MSTSLLRRRSVAAIVATLACITAACGSGETTEEKNELTPLSMVTYGTAAFSWMTEFAAANGVFERNGLDVTLEPVKSSTIASAALTSGSVDISLASPMSQLPAIVKGADVQMISGETGNPFAFTVNPDSASDAPWPEWVKNYDDKKIGVTAIGSGGYFFTKLMFKEAGLSDEKVEYVACGSGPECNVALETGRIDAVMSSYPYVGELVAKDKGVVLLDMIHQLDVTMGYPADLVEVAGATYIGSFAKRSWIEKNPGTVEKYQLAMMEASCIVNNTDNRQAFADFVRELGAVPASVSDDELVDFVYSSLRYSAAAPVKDADAWGKFVVELGGLENAPAASEWTHPDIAQSDTEVIERVEAAGGSCSI